jgi:hypothetical protein
MAVAARRRESNGENNGGVKAMAASSGVMKTYH